MTKHNKFYYEESRNGYEIQDADKRKARILNLISEIKELISKIEAELEKTNK